MIQDVFPGNSEMARRMRALDDEVERAIRFLAGRETDRFGCRHLGVPLADDLGPAADDRGLDEAELLEAGPGDVAQQVAARAGMAAAGRL